MLTAITLLSITGLDILPLALTLLLSGRFDASSEWWNEPVLSWISSVLWQPHSIAAACRLLTTATGSRWRQTFRCPQTFYGRFVRLSCAAIGGAAFASALGLSIYVAFTFGIF